MGFFSIFIASAPAAFVTLFQWIPLVEINWGTAAVSTFTRCFKRDILLMNPLDFSTDNARGWGEGCLMKRDGVPPPPPLMISPANWFSQFWDF